MPLAAPVTMDLLACRALHHGTSPRSTPIDWPVILRASIGGEEQIGPCHIRRLHQAGQGLAADDAVKQHILRHALVVPTSVAGSASRPRSAPSRAHRVDADIAGPSSLAQVLVRPMTACLEAT